MADEDPWRRAWEAGRLAWPGVALTFADFRELAARAPSAADERPPPQHGSDLYLACAVLQGDATAFQSFDTELVQPARFSITRVHAAPDFVEDVLQELRRKLALGPDARLARYTGQSPLEGWVRVAATRLAFDLARSAGYRVHEANVPLAHDVPQEVLDPELDLLKRTLGPRFQAALRNAISELSLRDRVVLRMHVVDGLSIDQIAAPYRVHRATASRWLADIRSRILDAVRTEMIATVGAIEGADFDSLARLVASQLHLSLARLESPAESAAR